jgi:spore coat protein U-like protein
MRPARRLLWIALLTTALVSRPGHVDAALTCAIATTPLAFGSYDPILANSTSPLDSLGMVRYDCTGSNPTILTIMLSAGTGSGFNPRRLFSGSNALSYNLYLDAGRTTVWGDGTGGTSFVAGTKKKDDVNVFGRVFAGQDPAVGSYANSIVVTINF